MSSVMENETNSKPESGSPDTKSNRMLEAASRAVRSTIKRHKCLQQAIAVDRDGEIVIIEPESIPSEEPDDFT